MLAPLLLALPAALAAPQTPLLPALHHGRRDARGWMQRFEASRGSDVDALWCLYRGEHHTPEVLAFLRRWLADGSPRVQREVEAILLQWEIPHDPPPSPWPAEDPGGPAEGGLHRLPKGPFALPAEPLAGSLEAAAAALGDSDPVNWTRAAVRVVLDGGDARRVARSAIERVLLLEEDQHPAMPPGRAVPREELAQAALGWIGRQCPTETAEAFLEVLAASTDRERRRRLLLASRFAPARTSSIRHLVPSLLAALAATHDAPGDAAWEELLECWWAVIVPRTAPGTFVPTCDARSHGTTRADAALAGPA